MRNRWRDRYARWVMTTMATPDLGTDVLQRL